MLASDAAYRVLQQFAARLSATEAPKLMDKFRKVLAEIGDSLLQQRTIKYMLTSCIDLISGDLSKYTDALTKFMGRCLSGEL